MNAACRIGGNDDRNGETAFAAFRESDRDDLYAFLSQLEDDEFEGYPGSPMKTAGSTFGNASVRRNFTPSCSRIPEGCSAISIAG